MESTQLIESIRSVQTSLSNKVVQLEREYTKLVAETRQVYEARINKLKETYHAEAQKAQVSVAESLRKREESALASFEATKEDLRREALTCTATMSECKRNLDTMTAKFTEAEARIAAIQGEMQTQLQAARADHAAELARVKEQYDVLGGEKTDLTTRYNQEVADLNASHEQRMTELRKTLALDQANQLSSLAAEHQRAVSELQERVNILEQELAVGNAGKAQAQTQIQELNANIVASRDAATRAIAEATKRNDDLGGVHARELKELKDGYARQQQDYERQAIAEIEIVKSQLSRQFDDVQGTLRAEYEKLRREMEVPLPTPDTAIAGLATSLSSGLREYAQDLENTLRYVLNMLTAQSDQERTLAETQLRDIFTRWNASTAQIGELRTYVVGAVQKTSEACRKSVV